MLAIKLNKLSYLQMGIRKLVNKIHNQVIANELNECSRDWSAGSGMLAAVIV
jgi:hypothetical protein